MTETIKTDICVIGAGSGGLATAAGSAMLGVPTVLIEEGKMGGDCLNYGCVPSKSLLAAAKHAAAFGSGTPFGIGSAEPRVDFQAVHDHVHGVIAKIAPTDSVERFEGLGVKVIAGKARFFDAGRVRAGQTIVEARRFVIATGSKPFVPPIPGLDQVPYLTNETIFDHLVIIGGGPIGMEMAQAHRRLGAEVTVIEAATLLSKDDPDLSHVVIERLRAEGVQFRVGAKVSGVTGSSKGIAVTYEIAGTNETIEGSHLLVAVGRTPSIADLNLEAAGVTYSNRGITVDSRLRTSNKRIYAIGDAAGGLQFTHVAGYHAGIVIRNALFRVPARADKAVVPWVTYTDPELAHVGLTEHQARQQHRNVHVLTWKLEENDRAQAERRTEGLIKVVLGKRGKVLGATIVAPHAGDLIQSWILIIGRQLPLSAVANMIVPYPTLGEISKRAAGSYFSPTLFSPRVRLLVSLLRKFG
jgi:pyruvate/2-oxoglutarate dehydrogenase complex dihydrolipoamide dehydrogenase (E3) component